MRIVTADEVNAKLDFPGLIGAIRAAFAGAVYAPQRHHHRIPRPGGSEATIILMPAWLESIDGFVGVKIVTVFPDNGTKQMPSVMATYMLLAGDTGEPLASIDGRTLTLWRTAATSALMADALARSDSATLAMLGAGALAPFLIAAHATVRPIRNVLLWNRTPGGAATRIAAVVNRADIAIASAPSVEAAVSAADIVSSATLSPTPLVHGASLKPGTHVDLVGAYTPEMREADDEAIRRARVFVDTRAGMRESGDIAVPLASGVLAEADIAGDLYDIARRKGPWRQGPGEITLFKSVGHAIEDLAAAVYLWRRLA